MAPRGQQRYDYMRQLVINNVDAYVVMCDLSAEDPCFRDYFFNNIISLNSPDTVPRILVFTHGDLRHHAPDQVLEKLRKQSLHTYTAMQLDPRNADSVENFLNMIAGCFAKHPGCTANQFHQLLKPSQIVDTGYQP